MGTGLSSGADAVRSSSLFRRLRYHCAVPRSTPGLRLRGNTLSRPERRQAVSVLSLASCWDGYGQTGTTGNDGPFVAHSWAANGRTRENRCPLCGTLWGPSHTICIRQTLCEFFGKYSSAAYLNTAPGIELCATITRPFLLCRLRVRYGHAKSGWPGSHGPSVVTSAGIEAAAGTRLAIAERGRRGVRLHFLTIARNCATVGHAHEAACCLKLTWARLVCAVCLVDLA